MKKFCFCLISLVVLLFVGFSTYYIIRNDENIAYTVSDDDTIYLNLGEKISSPVVHTKRAAGSKVQITLSNNCVVYDEENEIFIAALAGSTTVTCVPSNTNFPGISFSVQVGDGTSINPFYIRNQQDFENIGEGQFSLSSNYEIVADLSFNGTISPIGDLQHPFEGNIFGGENMHVLSNVHIASQANYAGIFASLSPTAQVERIVFDGVYIDGNYDYAGAIAAVNNGFIGQCKIKSQIANSSENGFTGGVAGVNQSLNSNARISLCTVETSINASGTTGGIVGKNQGAVIDNVKVESTASLYGSAKFGGIVGISTYASGNVSGQTNYYNSKFINIFSNIKQTGSSGEYFTVAASTQALSSQKATQTYYDMILVRAQFAFKSIGNNAGDSALIENGLSSVGYYKNLSPIEIEEEESYTSPLGSSWDFESFWAIEDGNLTINYLACAGSYQELPWSPTNKMEISTAERAMTALQLMRENPSVNLQYLITDSIDIDYNGQTIKPIGSLENPFYGKFVAAEDVVVTISNFVIDGDDYAGFFGVIAGAESVISGVDFEGAVVSGDVCGVIAASNSGSIINCSARDCQISGKSNVGGLVGINLGTISRTLALSEIEGELSNGQTDGAEEININMTSYSAQGSNVGIIAGTNAGKIENISLLTCTINLLKDTDQTLNIGGFVGMQNGGLVSNCSTWNSNVNGVGFQSAGYVYAGGLIGQMLGGRVYQSFVTTADITLSQSGKKIFAGGIAGFVAAKAKIESCVFDSGTFTATNVGGIVGVLHGEIEKSAVESTVILNGSVAAGLACECFGGVTNCYTFATLNASTIEAGFVGTLGDGAAVKFCYNYCAYNGSGTGYCETSTPFRSKKGNWQFLNNIVIGYKVGGDELFGILGDTFVTQCRQRGYYTIVVTTKTETDADGNPVYLTDADGNVLMDENNQPIAKTYEERKEVLNSAIKKINIQHKNNNKGSFVILTEIEAKDFTKFTAVGFNSSVWNVNGGGEETDGFLSLFDLPYIPLDA